MFNKILSPELTKTTVQRHRVGFQILDISQLRTLTLEMRVAKWLYLWYSLPANVWERVSRPQTSEGIGRGDRLSLNWKGRTRSPEKPKHLEFSERGGLEKGELQSDKDSATERVLCESSLVQVNARTGDLRLGRGPPDGAEETNLGAHTGTTDMPDHHGKLCKSISSRYLLRSALPRPWCKISPKLEVSCSACKAPSRAKITRVGKWSKIESFKKNSMKYNPEWWGGKINP